MQERCGAGGEGPHGGTAGRAAALARQAHERTAQRAQRLWPLLPVPCKRRGRCQRPEDAAPDACGRIRAATPLAASQSLERNFHSPFRCDWWPARPADGRARDGAFAGLQAHTCVPHACSYRTGTLRRHVASARRHRRCRRRRRRRLEPTADAHVLCCPDLTAAETAAPGLRAGCKPCHWAPADPDHPPRWESARCAAAAWLATAVAAPPCRLACLLVLALAAAARRARATQAPPTHALQHSTPQVLNKYFPPDFDPS